MGDFVQFDGMGEGHLFFSNPWTYSINKHQQTIVVFVKFAIEFYEKSMYQICGGVTCAKY